jgi:hypothetical protein
MLLSRHIAAGDVVLECSDAIAELASSLLDTLIELDRKGPPLVDGSKVQFGWSMLTLQAQDSRLQVCEPDFLGDISGVRPNADITLAVLKEQVSALHAAGEEGVDVSYRNWVAVAQGCLQTADLFLKRDPPLSGEDSGWFVGRLEDLEAGKSAEVQAMHVYEVFRLRPRLVNVMALPPGYLVIFRGDSVRALLDKDLHVRWGAYP